MVIPLTVLILLIQLSALPDEFTVGLTGEATPVYGSHTDQLVALAAIVTTLFISAVMTTFVSAATTRIVADAYVGQPDDGQTLHRTSAAALFAVDRADDPLVRRRVRRLRRSASSPGCGCRSRGRVAIPVLMLERTSVFTGPRPLVRADQGAVLAGVRRGLAESAARSPCSASGWQPGSAGSSSRATAPRPKSSRSR